MSQTYQVQKKSFKGNMLQLTTGTEKPVWFFLDNAVMTFAKSINPGDEIEIQFKEEQGKGKIITFLKKGTGANPAPTVVKTEASAPAQQKTYVPAEKTSTFVDEGLRKTRSSVLGATATIIAGMEGIDRNNVLEIFDEVFNHLENKVNGKENDLQIVTTQTTL